MGHLRKDCPLRDEVVGHSTQAANAEDLTEAQLEKLLAECRLSREKVKLESASSANAVTASEEQADTVGTWIHVKICIEGLPVPAMIDTGAQSTIISRETLNAAP